MPNFVAFVLLIRQAWRGTTPRKKLEEYAMRYRKNIITVGLLAAALGSSACSGAFWGGTAAGALATGAGYELQSRRQMDRLEDDLRSGRIDRNEYEDRKRQIERGSIIY